MNFQQSITVIELTTWSGRRTMRYVFFHYVIVAASRCMTEPDQDNEDTPAVERRSEVSTFGLLANETRLAILRALADAPAGLSFSRLFEATPPEDTGNFNYHLSQLVGSFVQKQGESYELTVAGQTVVGTMVAGTHTSELSAGPIPTEWECLRCDGSFTLECVGTQANLRCTDCGTGSTVSIPPSAVESIPTRDLPATVINWYRSRVQRLRAGFCHRCSSHLDRQLVEGVDPEADSPTPSMVKFDCRRCSASASVSGATLVTFHPVVEGFFRQHGIDTGDQHPTQVWHELDRSSVRTISDDPLEVEVVFTMNDETASARIAADGTLGEVRRGTAA